MDTANRETTAPATPRQRLFPLHLSPIESFMLADDQPGYPMTFVIHLQLAGQIDRRAFEDALAEALQRHPLLRRSSRLPKGACRVGCRWKIPDRP